MAKNKKKNKNHSTRVSTELSRVSLGRRKFPIFLYAIIGLIVVLLAILFFLLWPTDLASIYVSNENPKQGDTVFIRVKSAASEVIGNFGQSFGTAQDKEKLVFYRKGNSQEWISFLGIDVIQKPGDYKIFVDTSNAEHLVKEIKVAQADFSSAAAAPAPTLSQTGITQIKAVDNIVKKDAPALKKFLNNLTPEPYFTSAFSFPLSKVKKVGYSFGKFIGFGTEKIQHLGVDLVASENTNVYAVNDGKVVATLDLSNYGKTVIIDHGLDIFSLYLHLEEFKVAKGDMVKRSQLIGLSGKTGYVTAPHLHFSMRVNSSRVDPIAFIEATKKMNDNFILADISNAFLNIINYK